MRSAGDWEAANRPERACVKECFVAVSKPIYYARDQNDCDEAWVSVYCASLFVVVLWRCVRMRLEFTKTGRRVPFQLPSSESV
jgi:hypothetical protein